MDKLKFIAKARELAAGYQPSADVYSQLADIDLVAIVGPTGVGKTAILNELGIPLVKSDVSRGMRPEEKNDENYHFRNDYESIIQSIESSHYAQFLVSRSDEFYGTHKDSYPPSGHCAMAIVAEAIDSFRSLGFKSVTPIFIMPPGYVEWMRRVGASRHRDIHERIDESIQSIKIAISDPEYHFVLNDNIELAVRDIHRILNGEPVDEHRARLARETSDVLLKTLGDQDDNEYFPEEG